MVLYIHHLVTRERFEYFTLQPHIETIERRGWICPSSLSSERKECTYSAWGTWKVHGHAGPDQCSILKEVHTAVSFHLFTALFLTGCALGYHHATKKIWGNDLCILQFPKHSVGCIVAKVNFWGVCETCLGWVLQWTGICQVVWLSANYIFPLEAD